MDRSSESSSLQVRDQLQVSGIEVMLPQVMAENQWLTDSLSAHFKIMTGVRYYQLNDRFRMDAQGGILGESFWDTTVDNSLFGPQLAVKAGIKLEGFLLEFYGCCLAGYNLQSMNQNLSLGDDLIPGQHNHPLYFPKSYRYHEKVEEDFAPLLELRATASYQFTERIALKLSYAGTFVDNIRRASEQVLYELPRMGFREEAGTQRATINNVFAGFEAVY